MWKMDVTVLHYYSFLVVLSTFRRHVEMQKNMVEISFTSIGIK